MILNIVLVLACLDVLVRAILYGGQAAGQAADVHSPFTMEFNVPAEAPHDEEHHLLTFLFDGWQRCVEAELLVRQFRRQPDAYFHLLLTIRNLGHVSAHARHTRTPANSYEARM